MEDREQNFPCDRCGLEILNLDSYYTVPLDPQWQKTSGMYCTLKCALVDNEFVNRPMRGVDEWMQRQEWMLMYYNNTPPQTLFNLQKRHK